MQAALRQGLASSSGGGWRGSKRHRATLTVVARGQLNVHLQRRQRQLQPLVHRPVHPAHVLAGELAQRRPLLLGRLLRLMVNMPWMLVRREIGPPAVHVQVAGAHGCKALAGVCSKAAASGSLATSSDGFERCLCRCGGSQGGAWRCACRAPSERDGRSRRTAIAAIQIQVDPFDL
jgi:hypothetical protein